MSLIRLGSKELEDIGERIRDERVKKNLRQIDLADEIGVGRNVIYKIESGNGSLSVEYLYYISQILGKPMDYFITNNDSGVVTKVVSDHSDAGGVKGRLSKLLQEKSDKELSMIERVVKAFFDEGG